MTDLYEPPVPMHLLSDLLRMAGIGSFPETTSLLGVSTAQVWAIHVQGHDFVLRSQPDGTETMVQKESYMSTLLHHHHIAAPHLVAALAHEDGIALLSTRLPRTRLDTILPTLSPQEHDRVWHAVGAALGHIHTITFPYAGEIVGKSVTPFPYGWNQWVLHDMLDDSMWLQQHLALDPIPESQLATIVAWGHTRLATCPIRLLHNDALPQNILVAHGANGWHCTGWIDWEFSQVGDPLWDIATLDFRPAQRVPETFYTGYGHHPLEADHALYAC